MGTMGTGFRETGRHWVQIDQIDVGRQLAAVARRIEGFDGRVVKAWLDRDDALEIANGVFVVEVDGAVADGFVRRVAAIGWACRLTDVERVPVCARCGGEVETAEDDVTVLVACSACCFMDARAKSAPGDA